MERLGIESSGELSPLLRICIGISLVLFAATPFVLVAGKVLHWLRWW